MSLKPLLPDDPEPVAAWAMPADWRTWEVAWEQPLKDCAPIDKYKLAFPNGDTLYLEPERTTIFFSGPPEAEALVQEVTVMAFVHGYLLPCLDVEVSTHVREAVSSEGGSMR